MSVKRRGVKDPGLRYSDLNMIETQCEMCTGFRMDPILLRFSEMCSGHDNSLGGIPYSETDIDLEYSAQ